MKAIGENTMEKVFDVVALGELLIDFTLNGMTTQGDQLFEANPGYVVYKEFHLLSSFWLQSVKREAWLFATTSL